MGKVVIVLTERETQEIEQAALDHDSGAALELIERVLYPRVLAELAKGHCKPAFELPRGTDLTRIAPPPTGKPPTG